MDADRKKNGCSDSTDIKILTKHVKQVYFFRNHRTEKYSITKEKKLFFVCGFVMW